eukprot:scaffold16219_cov65-Phaeocystis_antarctica.AAC.6
MDSADGAGWRSVVVGGVARAAHSSFRSFQSAGTIWTGGAVCSGDSGGGAAPGMMLGPRTKPASERIGSIGW